MAELDNLKIAIIGAGPGGIAAGRELLTQGLKNFTIFEATDAVGGTWHIHTYPGLACDVWAHSYTFSYAPNPDWTASFVTQPEIKAYLQRSATEFGLDPHIKLNTRVTKCHYDEAGFWQLQTESGEAFEFDVIINAMGNQHTPLYPNAKGIENFKGDYWHGTRWNHDVSLEGKRVAVIGSAASAVQIVPEVAKQASQLTVLQRSANWIMPRNRRFYSPFRRALYRRFPFLIKLTKGFQRLMMSLVADAVTLGHSRMGQFENVAIKYINKNFPPGPLRDAVTPDTPYGCKRGLVSDDFYPALNRDNVELVAEALQEVKEHSIVTESGREIDVDVIVYCTGYRVQDFDRIDVTGANGSSLADQMAETPEGFKGIAAPGFPNYFFAVGPNGLVLNVSFFITVELNVKTIVRLLKQKQEGDFKTITVNADKHREYNDWLQSRFGNFSWGAPSCSSYYSTATGHVPFLFAGDFKRYSEFHNECDIGEFDTSSC